MTTAQLDTPIVSRRFWSGMIMFVCALLVAPMVASQLGRQLLGTGYRLRPALYHAGTGAEYRGRLHRSAGYGGLSPFMP